MGFWDNPIVDRNAERSEESVLKTQLAFSLKNGFNSHIVDGTKDFGVDIHCEVIHENKATGNLFPIQIKSVQKAQYVLKKSGEYFSLPFLTSRLGYLCRNFAGLGIIVFYNEEDETLYYDFIEEIYNRVRSEKIDETWKNNKTINIHIPVENVLKDNLNEIHKKLINRFLNIRTLIEAYGDSYNIPSANLTSKKENSNDNNRVRKAVHYLETIGPHLFNKREYPRITALLDLLPQKELKRPKVSYIAALTYAETGNFMDADYFLKICFSKKDFYTEEEFVSLEMQKFKVDFYFGIYDIEELKAQLTQIKKKTSNEDNIVNIDINISMLEISQMVGTLDFDKSIIREIEKVFEKIENITQNEEQKNFQKIFQAENLINALARVYTDHLNNNRLLSYPSSLQAIKKWNLELKEITDSFYKVVTIINDSLTYAESNNNNLMKAHAMHKIALAFFTMNFSLFINENNTKKNNDAKAILEAALDYAIKGYNLFLEKEVLEHAFIAITLAYEIFRLSEEWLGESLNEVISIKEIKSQIQKFEKHYFFKPFNSTIDRISNYFLFKDKPSNIDDKNLEILAERMLNVKNLPEERKTNLHNEMKSYMYFEKRCNRDDLDLLSNQVYLGDFAYSKPTKYAIASKKTGAIYIEGYDIKLIMNTLGVEKID
ncbi:MAG: hypothetical protein A2W90_19265 [Bacteroidetes bacterium GWF2_42_66]|nr:MAG: hypothetical protein A2W92_18215 [Bacteroidetes bacterium GWA2_42_15]OFX98693.1 MAG: hypothetical protein A2W89_10430 [Bacteroidetes bacterium GWE2_42_39]OFY43109.1 MAG: hypothetical protein A2W90_19265 [Bacteroidetes bacterium GWF2_42_66]HBL77044.1 hypothetical protein [Prolixibacteraceae bacterium]HCU59901.1 hypothetical protein [Prolixibacteraceae bacterium]